MKKKVNFDLAIVDIENMKINLEDLMEMCFLDEKKLNKKQYQRFDAVFKAVGFTERVKDKRKINHSKQGFIARFCSCLKPW